MKNKSQKIHGDLVMSKEQWRDHLKGLLSDVVADYMNDETLSADMFVDDLREEVHSWMMYHKDQYAKASEIYDKL
jgi:hypothetical protein